MDSHVAMEAFRNDLKYDAFHDRCKRDVTFGAKHFHYTTEVLHVMIGVRAGSH